jgi:hypothetical protein
MSSVRVLVGTRKGAFILTGDGKRDKWDVSGPLFGGWEIYHLKGSAADPNRLFASQTSSWFGQIIQRSDDGGKTWKVPGGEKMPEPYDPPGGMSNNFVYAGEVGTHLWYDGTPRPWEFKRVWHLEPSLKDPDTVYAGVEDAALFHSTDGGQTWQELTGLRGHESGPLWQPGAGGMCLSYDPSGSGESRPDRRCHLGGRRLPIRRRRHDVAADQPGTYVPIHARSNCRGRPLRSPHRDAPVAPQRAVHAEALGCDAQRRRRRVVA